MKAELAALELRKLTRKRVKKAAAAIAEEFTRFDLLTYSSAISFQVLYVVIPLVMLGLAGLGIVGEQSLYTHHIAPALQRALSHDAYDIANRTAKKAIGPEKLWWATIGLLVALWGVGAALRSMMTPLNGIYGTDETRSWLHRLVVSIAGGFLVMVCVYAAILVVLGGRLIQAPALVAVPLFLGRWLLAIVFVLLAIATLIRIVPAKKRPVGWVSLGSALSAVCWIVASLGFTAYITTVSYSSFYGAFAAVILLLIYLHVSAIAFLLGVTVDSLLRDVVRTRRGRASRPSSRKRS